MIRSSSIITFAVSLLLWSGQIFGDAPLGVDACAPIGACDMTCYPMGGNHVNGYQGVSPFVCPSHGQACPRTGCPHFLAYRPLPQGLGQRLGSGEGIAGWRPVMMRPGVAPVGPQPSGGFVGSLFAPRQYQYADQYPGSPAPGQQQLPVGGPQTERIVYVPYAAPPPITVERLGKALPIFRPPFMRRVLGDAYMYEYPEMPLQLYTTRGPRDFFAPNPPSIGE